MKRLALITLLGLLSLTATHAADPITFQEISLLLRTGENQQTILNDATQRKLLQPLTAEQEVALRAAGATPALLTALHAPELLATPEAVATYRAHHQAPPAPVPAQNVPRAPVQPAAAPARALVNLPDLFSKGIESAKTAPDRTVQMTDCFSLDQLADAKAKAQREHKPLGFLLVWNQYFGPRASTRLYGGSNALHHFYEAFKDSVVLVFVHHESDLGKVPPAVTAGYGSPDEGGYAPNMAVVDATASELIVEIPCAGPKGRGADRDAVFKIAAARMQAWMNAHPNAVATPPAAAAR
jgi:hypothetical protein